MVRNPVLRMISLITLLAPVLALLAAIPPVTAAPPTGGLQSIRQMPLLPDPGQPATGNLQELSPLAGENSLDAANLSITKAAPKGVLAAGESITYTVTVTNTGDTTQTGVVITDTLLSPQNAICDTLLQGNACTLTGSYSVTQADVDAGQIINIAIAASDQITTAVMVSRTTTLTQTASLSLDKPAPAGTLAAGVTLTYTLTAENTGSITQHAVTISDSLITPSSTACVTLAPGGICVLTGTYLVTQADVDAGTLTNTASVTSTEVTAPVTATQTVSFTQSASLTLDKPAPEGTLAAGETLTYTLTAENTGTITQHAVTLNDPLLTPDTTACATLAPGGTCVLTGTYLVTQADVDAGTLTNTASVTSTEVTSPVTATQTVSFTQSASLMLEKPAPVGTLAAGEILIYTVIATNTGTITQHNVVVTDDLLSPSTQTCLSVAPNGTCRLTGTYLVTQGNVDTGVFTNTASVASTEVITPVIATRTVTFTQSASLTLDKPAPTGTLAAGETLTYTLTAENTGTITQHAVTLSDPLLTPDTTACATLAPGGTCVLTGTYLVTQADVDAGTLTNTASVTSTEVSTPATATQTVTFTQSASLMLEKPAPVGTLAAGEILIYTVIATNTGTITQHNVVVTDDLLSPSTQTCLSVAPNGTCRLTGTYLVTQANVDTGVFTNTASVVSTEVITPVTATRTVTFTQTASLTLDKPAPAGTLAAGETLTYTLTAENTGTITQHAVTLSDPLLTPDTAACATLAPNATCVLVGTYIIQQTDVNAGTLTNTASVTSTEVTAPVTATQTVTFTQSASLTLDKPAPAGTLAAGETLTYTLTAENTGTLTQHAVTLSDSLLTPDTTACATLAPNATCVLTGTYVVTQSDVDAGTLTNTAAVTSTAVTTPVTATRTVTFTQSASLTLDKPAPVGTLAAGEILIYTVTATNTGTITQHNVVVTDDLLSPSTQTCLSVAPNGTCRLTGTYLVTQANVDTGVFTNTASVVSTEVITPVTATRAVTFTQSASLTLDKPAPVGTLAVGETLTYTLTAENTGSITQHAVTLSDPLLTPDTTACATLAPGGTCVLVGTYIIQQTDVDAGTLTNTASVTSTEVSTPVTATQTVTFTQSASLTLDKPAPAGTLAAGETLTYTLTAENTGTITQHAITLSDPLLTPDTNACDTLAPGGTCVLTGTYIIQQTDVDAGTLTNTASVTSTEVSTPVTATRTVTFTQSASLTLDKPAPAGTLAVGETLTYTLTAENTGSITQHAVTISDSLITPSSTVCATLAPGGTCVLVGTYVVTQSDVDAGTLTNTASVTSTEVMVPVTATRTVTFIQSASLTLDKPAPAGTLAAGETLTYTLTAENTGTVTQHAVTLSDPLLTPDTTACATLAPGGTCVLTGTYLVTQSDVDAGTLTNTASVTSTEVTAPVTATQTVSFTQSASLTLDKPAPTGTLEAGEILVYTVTATNTGTITQHNVVVTDDLLSPSTQTCLSVAPNGTCRLTGTYLVTQANVDTGVFTNTASVVSTEVITPVTATRSVSFTQSASLSLDKPAPVGTLAAGETLTYTLTAENTGTLTQHAVTLSDPLLTPDTTACATLAPGGTCVLVGTYIIQQTDVDAGTLTNTASVTSTEVTTPVTATQTVTFTQSASLTLAKPAPTGTLAVGETLTYTLTAENTGTITQHAVTISDNLITPSSTACATLAPGGTCVLTGTYLVTQADVDAGTLTNTASVTSTEVTAPVTATQTVSFVQSASLSLDKPAPAGTLAAGATLTYTLTAENTGTVTQHAVTLSDPLLTPDTTVCATLAPGGTCILTGTYMVTQADVDAGALTNTASVTSTEVMVPVTATRTVTFTQTASLTLDKPAPAGTLAAGETLTYTLTAENTGTVTQHAVTLSDPLLTPDTTACATLAPGGTCVLTGTYLVTQADVDAGTLTNTASVTSTEVTAPVTATRSVTFTQSASLTLDKPAPAGTLAAGETLTYTLTAENTGSITQHTVTLSDPLLTPDTTACATLAPGGTCVLVGTYAVTQADVDAGTLTNTASVTSTEVTALVTATQTVSFTQSASLMLDKPAPAGTLAAGETLTYTLTAENTGTLTQHAVTISDPLLTPDTTACATLVPNATCVLTGIYVVTQSDVDAGTLTNTASVTSTEVTVPVTATRSVTFTQSASLTLDKPAPTGTLAAGEVLIYTVTATNTGTITQHNVVVTDDLLSPSTQTCLTVTAANTGNITQYMVVITDAMLSPNSATCITLAPTATCVLTGAYMVTQADIDAGRIVNTASVTSNEVTVPVSATQTTLITQAPALSLAKGAPEGSLVAGATITYTIIATNTGNTTQSGVVITDAMLNPNSTTCTILAPTATCVLTGAYMVTQADIDAGRIVNTASVASAQITTPITVTRTTLITQSPGLHLEKSAPVGSLVVGETLTYTITATNSGDVTQTHVVISDTLLSPGLQTCPSVPRDATCVLVGAYILTQADVDAGAITNVASVTSDQVTVPVTATRTTIIPPGTRYIYLPLVMRGWPPLPGTPVLNAIGNTDGDGAYAVTWSSAVNATTYMLQESTNGNFTGAIQVYSGANTSVNLSGRGATRYYYRVRAQNSFGLSAWSNVHAVDVFWEHEPNDDATTQANGPLVAGVTYYGQFTTTADKQDYFFIQLASPQSVDIWLGNLAPGQDYDLVLRDAALTLVGYSGNVGNTDESILTHPLPAGTYYIQVYNHGGRTTTQAYHLWTFYPAITLTAAEDGALQPQNPPPEP